METYRFCFVDGMIEAINTEWAMNKQVGFTLVEGLLIALALSIVGFAGYSVWNNNDEDKPEQSSTVLQGEQNEHQNDKLSEDSDEEATAVPDGWIVYNNVDYGFSFAYPSELGQLNPRTFEDSPGILEYLSVDTKADVFSPSTRGLMIIRADAVEGYVGSAAKYGPTLEHIDDTWIVSSKNGGDVNDGGFVVGSVFDAEIAKTANGTTIYDFSSGDEGCYWIRWVFKTDKAFIDISLPSVCGDGPDISEPTETIRKAYSEQATKILDTVTIQ